MSAGILFTLCWSVSFPLLPRKQISAISLRAINSCSSSIDLKSSATTFPNISLLSGAGGGGVVRLDNAKAIHLSMVSEVLPFLLVVLVGQFLATSLAVKSCVCEDEGVGFDEGVLFDNDVGVNDCVEKVVCVGMGVGVDKGACVEKDVCVDVSVCVNNVVLFMLLQQTGV